ncbi:hypothetical protein, partial [Flavobacterium sp. Leaf82]|uniref:hypothetical protein n=2 Tax=unclassified Flavobacterium TaxID=196869 RepID=UPI000B020E2B
MIDKDIVIAILARDCGKTLVKNIQLVEELRSYFRWSQVVVVENDSKDNTKALLFDWEQSKSGVKIISQDYNTLTIPNKTLNNINPLVSLFRIEKMTKYRNIYIDYIKQINHNIDNLIVIDIDVKSFSVEGIVDSILKCEGECGAIFAYGITVKKIFNKVYSKIFYDLFAIQEYSMKNIPLFKSENSRDILRSISVNLKENEILYKVISAFGGIAVYNYRAICDLEYKVVLNSFDKNEAICEHIPFNAEIIKLGYSNYISKKMEVIYGEHSFIEIIKYIIPRKI